jgi:hypothetical protein
VGRLGQQWRRDWERAGNGRRARIFIELEARSRSGDEVERFHALFAEVNAFGLEIYRGSLTGFAGERGGAPPVNLLNMITRQRDHV